MNREVGPIGLSRLVEELGLRVPAPAVRSEAVRGGRRTRISGDAILEQYPFVLRTKGPTRTPPVCHAYEPVDVGVIAAAFQKIPPDALLGGRTGHALSPVFFAGAVPPRALESWPSTGLGARY